jgi:hypothetical protein
MTHWQVLLKYTPARAFLKQHEQNRFIVDWAGTILANL